MRNHDDTPRAVVLGVLAIFAIFGALIGCNDQPATSVEPTDPETAVLDFQEGLAETYRHLFETKGADPETRLRRDASGFDEDGEVRLQTFLDDSGNLVVRFEANDISALHLNDPNGPNPWLNPDWPQVPDEFLPAVNTFIAGGVDFSIETGAEMFEGTPTMTFPYFDGLDATAAVGYGVGWSDQYARATMFGWDAPPDPWNPGSECVPCCNEVWNQPENWWWPGCPLEFVPWTPLVEVTFYAKKGARGPVTVAAHTMTDDLAVTPAVFATTSLGMQTGSMDGGRARVEGCRPTLPGSVGIPGFTASVGELVTVPFRVHTDTVLEAVGVDLLFPDCLEFVSVAKGDLTADWFYCGAAVFPAGNVFPGINGVRFGGFGGFPEVGVGEKGALFRLTFRVVESGSGHFSPHLMDHLEGYGFACHEWPEIPATVPLPVLPGTTGEIDWSR